MNYSNSDSRITGKFVVPEDRIQLIRQLEKDLIANRIKRQKERRQLKRKQKIDAG